MTPNPNPSPELREISEDDLRESIRKTLEQPDMTQNLFARMHGISRGHLSEFLSGKRRAEPAIAGPCGYRWALVEDTRATDDLTDAALSPQTLPAPGEQWIRTKAFDEAAAECLRAAKESKFADTVSEDERKGYRTACNLMSMSFRVMASRAAPDWPPLATVAAANDEGVVKP